MTTRRTGRSTVSAIVFLALGAVTVNAQVPTYRQVTGHEFGERITMHHEMTRYLERVAAASPRVTLVDQGASWQRRRLPLAIVTSPENHARLAEIQRNAQRLGDPRSISPADAAALMANQPAVLWFGGSIHGFELSGSEGALKLFEHLTTRDDAATRQMLNNTVVLIDPILNPDGRDAFAQMNHERVGRNPSPDSEDWSNSFTGWQSLQFRTGHYFFDINRDWFAHTQAETRARVPTLRDRRPQVLVDMHEMGPDVEFYFDPADEPYGPFFPDYARTWFNRFGAAYAQAFDSAGFEYMTRERYNYFYPGYTTSYGSYQGAVGMLYEQGSTRGLALRRPDGSVRRLADALEQQYVAAVTAVRLASTQRESMLREYHEALRSAVADGSRGMRRYVISTGEGDPGQAVELARMLSRNGIEVDVLTSPVQLAGMRDRAGRTVGARTIPVGSFVVNAAQPRNRLLRVLLEPDLQMPREFLELARHRVERDENPRFYDISAWSLPLLFDVAVYSTADARTLESRRMEIDERPELVSVPRASYAYLIDGRQSVSLAALYHLRAAGHRVSMTLKPIRLEGSDVSSGTVVVRVGQNDTTVHTAVRDAAQRFNVTVRAVGTGLAAQGFPSLGSADVIPAVLPEIALLAEDGIQGYSFGWAWYTLDQQHEIPVTVLRSSMLGNTRLDRFNVIVIPDASAGQLSGVLGADGRARLRRWVQDGGTLVTIGGATELARDTSGLNLIALRSWYGTEAGRQAQQISVPGSIMRVRLDRDAWLSAGQDGAELPVLVNSNRVYLAPEGAPSAQRRTVGRYASRDALRIAGHLWPESLERLPEAVWAYEQRVGRGRVIAFAEEMNFRAYNRSANRLFLNAVVMGPSAP